MKCSNCSNEMVQSRAGWLCISCGHVEAAPKAAPADTPILAGKSSHDHLRKLGDTQPPKDAETTPPPPVKAAPWEAPAAGDTTEDEPPTEEPKDEAPDNAKPTEADLSAVEEAVAAIEAPASEAKADDKVKIKPTETPAEPTDADLSAVEAAVAAIAKPETEAPVDSGGSKDEASKIDDETVKPDEPAAEPEPEAEDDDNDDEVDGGPTSTDTPEKPVEPPVAEPEPEPHETPGPEDPQYESVAHKDDDDDKPLPPPVADQALAPPPAPPAESKPPLQPVTHPKPVTPGRVFVVVGAMVALVAAAVGGYLYGYSPKFALAGHLGHLGSVKSAVLQSTLVGDGDGYRYALKADGKQDLSDAKAPKLQLSITGEASADKDTSGTAVDRMSGPVTGEIVAVGSSVYVKADNLPAIAQLPAVESSKTWHQYTSGGFAMLKCLGSRNDAFFSPAHLKLIPVRDTVFKGVDTLNGAKQLHYAGIIDNSKLRAALDAANKTLATDCRLDLSNDTIDHVAMSYELWRGWSSDRLKLTFNDTVTKAVTTFILDSSRYGQAVSITAPEDTSAAPATASPSPSATATPAPTATPAATGSADSRNAQRRSDLAGYLAAYKAQASNGFYPVNAPPSTTYSANDPSTGKAYVVSKAKTTAVGQIEYRPGGACSGAGITPGSTGTRYIALTTLLDDGKTSYCLDNR